MFVIGQFDKDCSVTVSTKFSSNSVTCVHSHVMIIMIM